MDTYTITFTNGNTTTFTVTNGNDGEKGDKGDKGDKGNTGNTGATGNGISTVAKTGTSGLVDTYTITFTNGTTTTFTVTNGADGTVPIVTSWESTLSDSKVPSEKLTKTELDKKIAKSSTTGLVKNDGSIMTSGTGSSNWAVGNHTHSAYVNPTKVTSWSSTPSDNNVASEKLIKDSLDGKLDNAVSSTAITIASNDNILVTDYSDSNKVKRVANILASQVKDSTAHSNIGSSANDTQATINSDIDTALSNKVSKSSTTGLLKNDGSVMVSGTGSSNWAVGNHTHSAYVNPTKVTSWSSTPSDDNVASEKLIKDSLDAKQGTLISGTSIKTINNESLLGSGNISVGGGSSVDIVTAWESTPSDSKVASEKLTKDSLDGKSDTSHTHGNLASDGKISTTSSATMVYFTGVGSSANTLYKSNKLSSDVLIDGTAHSNIGSSANDSQSTINAKIDTMIGQAISYINQ